MGDSLPLSNTATTATGLPLNDTLAIRNASVVDVGLRSHGVGPNGVNANGQTATPIAESIEHYRGLPAYGLVRHAANVIPHRVAIVYGEKSWTYEELNFDIVRCAAMFQAYGVERGDRVGILLPNVPEFIIAVNAVWRAGGIAVALSPLSAANEIDKLVDQTECKVMVTLDMLAHLLAPSHKKLQHTFYVSIREHLPAFKQLGYLWMRQQRVGTWSLPSDNSHHWLAEEIATTRREWKHVPINAETDAAYILPTGGTTGEPKIVTLSHQNMVANAWQQLMWTRRRFAQDTMLAVLPFFHSYGVSAIVMGGAAMGATLVVHHRFNVRQVIALMLEHRPTVLHAVPAMLAAMNERLDDHPADLSSLKWVISGGAPLDAEIAEKFAEHSKALVVEGFGLSEASPVTHVGNLYDEPCYGTIGLPLPETQCRIVDEKGGLDDLGCGVVGEMIIRGPQVMLGYWKDPEGSQEAMRDGWLKTGDLATRDERGRYTIVGRKKDLIITSGFNVYPAEVEAVLQTAEGVAEVAVVGQPDALRGEVVKAFIVMQPDAEWDEDALRAHCREHLSKHKQPQIFERCSEELPKNFLGKIIRRKLREPDAEEGQDSSGETA
ncbi:AMP-binding protein [Aporhodopirellula aestuarii]|uniref:AMP-binding protein n=1 Tax=Aporhodopirellula aestuarii TaxID=2950107 RepID=A0ABT0UCT9_9BACT|nr:AMP-binding protein [Aporhodopirellula aestuarii]MCM2374601.1 AMP-binding protein [Aporhodopirellula aestuarii]